MARGHLRSPTPTHAREHIIVNRAQTAYTCICVPHIIVRSSPRRAHRYPAPPMAPITARSRSHQSAHATRGAMHWRGDMLLRPTTSAQTQAFGTPEITGRWRISPAHEGGLGSARSESEIYAYLAHRSRLMKPAIKCSRRRRATRRGRCSGLLLHWPPKECGRGNR